jgi:hypothetical protein
MVESAPFQGAVAGSIPVRSTMKELEVVYIEDFEIGGFTAFAPAINWAVAEGDSREEAKANLFRIIDEFGSTADGLD